MSGMIENMGIIETDDVVIMCYSKRLGVVHARCRVIFQI